MADGIGDGTRVARAGLPAPEQGAPFLPGPTFAAPFHARGDPRDAPFSYGRAHNPTWERYEAALGELEGGEAVLFASGMAAATAVLLTTLRPGQTLVMAADCYMDVRRIARDHLVPRGVELRLVPTAELAPPLEADLVWLESPSNPGLEVCDVAALASGPRMAVDNTTATPLAQRPLELGADYSVVSATKHLAGHDDLLLGYVATRESGRAAALRAWRTSSGAIPGPFEAWLAHRSLGTLALRLDRQCANAAALADLLAGRADVHRVRYPGLESDPAHAVAVRQMRRFGSLVSFDLGDAARAQGFLAAAQLVTEATSFGGLLTTAERRARWGGDEVPEGFVRLSAGCEDTADLLADVEGALDRAA
jgi:cystathionine gamma-lyase